jgi:hypothetical protein
MPAHHCHPAWVPAPLVRSLRVLLQRVEGGSLSPLSLRQVPDETYQNEMKAQLHPQL